MCSAKADAEGPVDEPKVCCVVVVASISTDAADVVDEAGSEMTEVAGGGDGDGDG